MLRKKRENPSTMTSILTAVLEKMLGSASASKANCLALSRLQVLPISHKPTNPTGIGPLKKSCGTLAMFVY